MNEITIYDNKAMVEIAENYLVNETNGLPLPKNYDYKSAVSALYLQCVSLKTADGQPALEVCTKESIARTVQDMLTKGLTPAKKQCYPIVYAQRDKDTKKVICYELQLQSSYFGNQKQAYINNPDIVRNSIHAQCIYKGDVFEFKIVDGAKVVTKHESKFENIKDANIIGAYATVKFKDGSTMSDIMTVEEIKKSWAMSRSGGSVHAAFSHEMACKTVTSRLAKHLNNITDDEATVGAPQEQPSISDEVIYADEIEDAEVESLPVDEEPVEAPGETPVKQEETEQPAEKCCANCGKKISDKVYRYSVKAYGKPLCMDCQNQL